MNRVRASEAFRIEQSSIYDLGNGSRSIVRTEQIAGAGFVRLRIGSEVFMLHQRIPDSGRHFHLVGTQRLQTKLKSFSLTLRIPDFKRLLAVSSQSEWNLGAADRVNRRCQGITMKEVHKSESSREFRNGFALAEHRRAVGRDQSIANRKHFAQPRHRIGTIVIRVPPRIVVVTPEYPLAERFAHYAIEPRNLLRVFRRCRRLSASAVSPLNRKLVITSDALHVGVA